MTKKIIKICTVVVVTGLIGMSMNSIFSFPTTVYAGSSDVKIVECMKGKPWTRYAQILRFFWDQIIVEGFWEGLVEPWDDIIFSNSCQAGDLLALIDRQDQIEVSIVKYLMTCELGQYAAAQKEYYKMGAEVYYVRHIINRRVRFGLPIDYATAKAKEDYAKLETVEEKEAAWQKISGAVAQSKLKKTMKAKFVAPLFLSTLDLGEGSGGGGGGSSGDSQKNYMLTDAEFENLFNKLADKYMDKKMDYAVCDFEPWQEIVDKLKEFKKVKEAFDNIQKTAKEGFDKWGKAWDKLSDQFAGENGLFTNPAGYFSSHIDLNIQGVDEFLEAVVGIGGAVAEGAKTVGDMGTAYVQAMQNYYGTVGSGGGSSSNLTISDARKGIDLALNEVSRMRRSTTFQSQLESLYFASDGVATANAAEAVLLDRTIQAAFPILKNLKDYSFEMQKTSY